MVVEDRVPWGFRRLGTVIQLLAGRDGAVRAVSAKTLLNRPLQRLYLLEVQDRSGADTRRRCDHKVES